MTEFKILETKLDGLAESFNEFKTIQRSDTQDVKRDIRDIHNKLNEKVVLCRDCILKHQTVDVRFTNVEGRVSDIAKENGSIRKLMYALVFSILLATATQFVRFQVGP